MLFGQILLLLVPAVSLGLQADLQQAMTIEQEAVAQRRRLVSGKVVIKEISRVRDARESSKRIVLYFDGQNIRTDWELSANSIRRFVLRQDGTFLASDTPRNQIARVMQVDVADRSSEAEHNRWIVDARVLGMGRQLSIVRGHASLDQILTRADREDVVVERAENRVKIAFVLKDSPVKVRLWFDPTQGNNLVRCEHEFDHRGSVIVDTTECSLQEYPEAHAWYPVKVTTYRRDSTGAKIMQRDFVVEHAEFNGQLDKSIFSLSGIDTKPATLEYDADAENSSR